MLYDVNYVAVLVAAVVAMVIGYVWYGPLFGKTWGELTGVKPENVKKEDMPKMYLFGYLLAALSALILAKFVSWAGATNWMDGALVGIYAAIGFNFTAAAMNNMYEMRPMSLTWLNVGYYLVNFAVMGAILASWA